jgi:hypothetical protein
VTDAAGLYDAPNLTPGTYTVRVEAPAFKTLERRNIVLGVGTEVRVDFTPQPGEVSWRRARGPRSSDAAQGSRALRRQGPGHRSQSSEQSRNEEHRIGNQVCTPITSDSDIGIGTGRRGRVVSVLQVGGLHHRLRTARRLNAPFSALNSNDLASAQCAHWRSCKRSSRYQEPDVGVSIEISRLHKSQPEAEEHSRFPIPTLGN